MRVPFDMFGTGQWQLLLDGVSAQEAFEKIKKKLEKAEQLEKGKRPVAYLFVWREKKERKSTWTNEMSSETKTMNNWNDQLGCLPVGRLWRLVWDADG